MDAVKVGWNPRRVRTPVCTLGCTNQTFLLPRPRGADVRRVLPGLALDGDHRVVLIEHEHG